MQRCRSAATLEVEVPRTNGILILRREPVPALVKGQPQFFWKVVHVASRAILASCGYKPVAMRTAKIVFQHFGPFHAIWRATDERAIARCMQQSFGLVPLTQEVQR